MSGVLNVRQMLMWGREYLSYFKCYYVYWLWRPPVVSRYKTRIKYFSSSCSFNFLRFSETLLGISSPSGWILNNKFRNILKWEWFSLRLTTTLIWKIIQNFFHISSLPPTNGIIEILLPIIKLDNWLKLNKFQTKTRQISITFYFIVSVLIVKLCWRYHQIFLML